MSWPPQQQGSRDMVAAAMMGERQRNIDAEGSFKRYIGAGGGATIAAGSEAKTHRFGQAVKQELRTYQLLSWMGFWTASQTLIAEVIVKERLMAEVGGDLRNETAKIKVDLEEANTELNAMKESHQGHDMQHEQQKSQWEDQVNELHKEINENNEPCIFMLEQDQEKLQRRNKELDDAYRVTGLMLAKAEDLAQKWVDSLGNAETQLEERNIELKNAQDQLVLYRQAVKPHQDQVLQDDEDIMVINSSDEALQQLQTADEDLHAKFVNLEQEQHQTLKANKILEVEVAKKQETVMNLAEQVKKLNAELKRAYQDIKHQNGLQAQKNNEIEELQSQLVTGPKAPSFAEESAIAKMQKDLDILEEQLAMTIHNKNDKTMQELTITLAISRDSQYWAHSSPEETGRLLPQKHDEVQNRWDIQKLVLLLSSREQERHKTYQELQGHNAQVQAQNQQIQSNLNDQTSQLHELQQKHNELQNKWDVQSSVLSSSSAVGSRRDTNPIKI
ncbi:hypothetical protein B0H14DRAFT_2627377 [Mycena olivaceomarginata]|nr:hypothetical protein B0H14DRAFT_2627377 [Mycena olivaceomarginata]